MSINIRQLNDGQPRQNPYGVGSGVVSQIPPSFSNVEYYDCYIPYALTNAQLGGYSILGGDGYENPMGDVVKQRRVCNYVNIEAMESGTGYIHSVISGNPNVTLYEETATHCNCVSINDSNGIPTKFYLTAFQGFFSRRSVGTGSPTDGYYGFTNTNEAMGQLIDVILTDGTCIHFLANDVNSIHHTNRGFESGENQTERFAQGYYPQYHNIVSSVSGNSLEISGKGIGDNYEEYANRKFANKYGLGVWGIDGVNDVAFYRMYHTRIGDGFTLANSSYADLSYTIDSQQPPTPTRTKTCFIGDSRANMLKQALEADGTIDTSNYSFIVQGGMGYEWLVDTAIPSFNSQSSNIKNCIVFQLGVNNINTSDAVVSQRANQYISTYNELANNNPDINFYFCTVGPVDETKDAYVTDHNRNEWIIQFNSAVSAGLNNKWTTIDLYTYLVQDGFKPTSEDGLHYANSVTMKMYNYVMNIVDSGETPTPPTPTEKQICFIGDSRIAEMERRCGVNPSLPQGTDFIAWWGQGYSWFVADPTWTDTETGETKEGAIKQFSQVASSTTHCLVHLGGNDVYKEGAWGEQWNPSYRAPQYKNKLVELASTYPNVKFYFVTCGLVDSSYIREGRDWEDFNDGLNGFNTRMKSSLSGTSVSVIDAASYLQETGFETIDGIHFTDETTDRLYTWIISQVDEDTPTPPSTYTVSVSNDGHGTASASPTSGSSGTQVTLTATPNSGYSFSKWEVISGGVTITNNKFTIGSSNVSVKAVFKKMGYSIPQVPYFCQWAGLINYQSMTISNSSEINISLGTNGEIVRDSGCGPSCASMALSYILGEEILISTLISKMGGYQSFMVDGVGDWGLGITLANAYGVQAKRTNSHTEALNALKQGNIVMAITGDATVGQLPSGNTKWSRGGHYILLVGATSDNKIAVNDPGEPRNTYWYRGANYGDWSETWREKQTVDWSQITPAVRAPGNSNSDSDKIAGSGAYTIFYVPEDKKSGEYEPTEESPYLELPVKEEKGIFGLKVDFDVWKAGTHLIRIGDSVKLKATYDSVAKKVTWADITNPTKPVYYTPSELKKHFGISYTKVNNGYVGRFYVDQEPLAPKYGGTGVASILDLMYAMFGTDSYAGGYDFSLTNSSNVGNALLPNSANKITLPSVSRGHIITVEAISDTRNSGSLDIGDQAQTISPSLKIDVSGEVAFVYDKDVKNATALYRLESPGDPLQSAEYKRMALCAANHACFLAQNANVGYNFYINGQEELWEYIKSQKGNITFGNVEFKANTNCINLCKLIYASVMYNSTNKKYFDALWTTEGILSGNTLENIGFTRHNASYAQNPINLEIGDILVFKQSKSGGGHASIVVASGTKSWELNGTNYNPKKGEVKT